MAKKPMNDQKKIRKSTQLTQEKERKEEQRNRKQMGEIVSK